MTWKWQLSLMAVAGVIAAAGSAMAVAAPKPGDDPTLYIGGNAIEPPYRVTVVNDTIRVNGFRYRPPVTRPPKYRSVPKPTALQVRRNSTLRTVRSLWLESLTSDVDSSMALAARRVTSYLESQDEVLSVAGNLQSTAELRLTWAPPGYTEFVSFPTLETLAAEPTVEEMHESLLRQAESLQASLDRGAMIIQDGGLTWSFQTEMNPDLVDEVRRALAGEPTSDKIKPDIVRSLQNPMPWRWLGRRTTPEVRRSERFD
jgi:hypothetical protein